MLRIVLFMLGASLISALDKEECLCTKSYVVLRTMPNEAAPLAGTLTPGSCLTPSQFTGSDSWYQVTRDQEPPGYLLKTGDLQLMLCEDVIPWNSENSNNPLYSNYISGPGKLTKRYCSSSCQSHCCGQTTHHHHEHSCHSCSDTCCNYNQGDGPKWSDWGHCSGTCGQGTRSRTCTENCQSLQSHTQTEICQHHISCPGPEWSPWSHCSGTCGQGTRNRTCTENCQSLQSHAQTETCQHRISCPVWSSYSECSVSCGDGSMTRRCLDHCLGLFHSSETTACHKPACEPVTNHVSDHVCDKVSVVQALTFQVPENCSHHLHQPYIPFVIKHCSAPSSSVHWLHGSRVVTSCDTLPKYSPVATFSGHHISFAGVFAGCVSNHEFKVIASHCGAPPQIMHITSRNTSFPYIYQVKW